jgi:hypothetical protein
MCKEKNITCYCLGGLDENKWIYKYQEYLQWLSKHLGVSGRQRNPNPNPYCDPDLEANSKAYYKNLAEFLNKQEENKKIKRGLKGTWHYKFIYDSGEGEINKIYGIAVYNEKNELLFFLKSDQFGFSAPKKNGKHIYDVYLENIGEEEKETAVENITKWILSTRTLGGGLLWPMEKDAKDKWNQNPQINMKRGGTKNYSVQYYIQDRIDLTLWEIKRYLDYSIEKRTEYYKNCQGDVLCKCLKACPNLKIWMDHFENFKTYVEFFCFEDFCQKGTYKPLNMMKPDTPIEEDYDKNDETRSIYHGCKETDNINMKDFCNHTKAMLDTLSDKIVARTEVMKKILENSEEK